MPQLSSTGDGLRGREGRVRCHRARATARGGPRPPLLPAGRCPVLSADALQPTHPPGPAPRPPSRSPHWVLLHGTVASAPNTADLQPLCPASQPWDTGASGCEDGRTGTHTCADTAVSCPSAARGLSHSTHPAHSFAYPGPWPILTGLALKPGPMGFTPILKPPNRATVQGPPSQAAHRPGPETAWRAVLTTAPENCAGQCPLRPGPGERGCISPPPGARHQVSELEAILSQVTGQ